MYNYGHWDLLIDDFDTDDYYGFIYIIINKINNRRYIGKRNFNVTGQHPDHWKKYTGTHIQLAEKLSLPSKRILRLLDGRTQTIAGWSLEGQDTANLRKFTRVIENVVTGEIITGSLNEIIDYIGTSNWCLRDLIAGKQKTTRDWKLIK